MGRSPPPHGAPPSRRSGARLLLAIAAVLVLGAMIGLAGHVRSAARGESDPAPEESAAEDRAPDDRAVEDRARPPASRKPSAAAPTGSRETAGGVPALPEAPLAEDRFLGAPETAPPSAAPSARRPPDPPRAPTEPEPQEADDPRDFEPTGEPTP